MKLNTLRNLKQSNTDIEVIEAMTKQRPSESDAMIQADSPMRKMKILPFRYYVQATGFLPERFHIDPSEMNDKQLADYAMIMERQSIRNNQTNQTNQT